MHTHDTQRSQSFSGDVAGYSTSQADYGPMSPNLPWKSIRNFSEEANFHNYRSLVAETCLFAGTCGQNTLTQHIFSCTLHMCLHHNVAQGAARRVCIKVRSSTCHHVSDCALSLHPLISSSLECLYNFSHFFISSILVIILHVVETAEYLIHCAPAE